MPRSMEGLQSSVSGSFSSHHLPRQHGLNKIAKAGESSASPLVTNPPLSSHGLGTQVDAEKANCCLSSGRWDGLGLKAIITGWLDVPTSERSGQMWAEWHAIPVNQPRAQCLCSQHPTIPRAVLEMGFVNTPSFRREESLDHKGIVC